MKNVKEPEQISNITGQKRQKPNEARWKKEQTKGLLKAARDAKDKIRMVK